MSDHIGRMRIARPRTQGDYIANVEPVELPRAKLSPVEALTQALEEAAERGHPGDPTYILQCLPESWGLVDTDAVAELAWSTLAGLGALELIP